MGVLGLLLEEEVVPREAICLEDALFFILLDKSHLLFRLLTLRKQLLGDIALTVFGYKVAIFHHFLDVVQFLLLSVH